MTTGSNTANDEALAKALQEQMDSEAAARASSRAGFRRGPGASARSNINNSSSHQVGGTSVRSMTSDALGDGGAAGGTSHSRRGFGFGGSQRGGRSQRGGGGTRAAVAGRQARAPTSTANENPDVSKDEEMARKLQQQEEMRASRRGLMTSGNSSHQLSTYGAANPSTHTTATTTGPDGLLGSQHSSHRNITTRGQRSGSSQRQSRSRSPGPHARNPSRSRSPMPRHSSRQLQQPKSPLPGSSRGSQDEPADSPSAAVERDAELARRLEQELQDEELARRLSDHNPSSSHQGSRPPEESATRSRRRANYLARKARNQNGAGAVAASQAPSSRTINTTTDQELPSASTRNGGEGSKSTHRGRSTHGRSSHQRQGRSKSSDKKSRGRSKSRDGSRGRSSSRSRRNRSRSRTQSPTPYNSVSFHAGDGVEQAPPMEVADMLARELAMKLEQEERDQEMAMQLNRQERRRVSVYHIDLDEQGGASPGRRRWTAGRLMQLSVPVIIILAAVVGLAFAFSGGDGIPSLTGSNPPIFEDDPFQGQNDPGNKWRTTGSGLSLKLLNALEDQWEALFFISVSEWDSGNPDALTLTTERVDVDPECSRAEGFLKVCNDNYGETRWRGINLLILEDGFITSSVAKLNEFYLANADEAQRQYTMCHEIGHGFGLPHTDENFFNADLFNCMDYTSTPENNKSPGEMNYVFLFDLYGVVNRQRRQRRSRRLRWLRGGVNGGRERPSMMEIDQEDAPLSYSESGQSLDATKIENSQNGDMVGKSVDQGTDVEKTATLTKQGEGDRSSNVIVGKSNWDEESRRDCEEAMRSIERGEWDIASTNTDYKVDAHEHTEKHMFVCDEHHIAVVTMLLAEPAS